VTILQAPNDDGLTWTDLEDIWQPDVMLADTRGVIGSVTLYAGLWAGDRLTSDLEAAELELYDAVPANPGAGWGRGLCRTGDEMFVWEIPCDGYPRTRRLVALADEATEGVIDRWLWTGDASGLAPFTRYLLHAAELRYQQTVLDQYVPHLQKAIDQVNEACYGLVGLLDDDTIEAGELISADRDLSRLQTSQQGLIDRLRRRRREWSSPSQAGCWSGSCGGAERLSEDHRASGVSLAGSDSTIQIGASAHSTRWPFPGVRRVRRSFRWRSPTLAVGPRPAPMKRKVLTWLCISCAVRDQSTDENSGPMRPA